MAKLASGTNIKQRKAGVGNRVACQQAEPDAVVGSRRRQQPVSLCLVPCFRQTTSSITMDARKSGPGGYNAWLIFPSPCTTACNLAHCANVTVYTHMFLQSNVLSR